MAVLVLVVLTTEHCVFARTAKCVAIARRLQTRSVHQVLSVRTAISEHYQLTVIALFPSLTDGLPKRPILDHALQ